MSESCFCGKKKKCKEEVATGYNKSRLIEVKEEEMSPELTHSPWRIDEDAEPGVSADPRGREIPGGELGSHSGLSAWHLLSPEAASIPLLPHVTGGAPAPVALLLLPIQALWFWRAWTSCSCRGGGAGGGSTRGLRVGVRA